jgi:hypothetical protein
MYLLKFDFTYVVIINVISFFIARMDPLHQIFLAVGCATPVVP